MRVLIIPFEFPSQQLPYNGIFILRRAQALRERGHEISVLRIIPLAPPIGKKWRGYGSIPRSYDVDGIPVRCVRAVFPPRLIGMEYLPWQVHRAVQREIARVNPDILHASYIIPCGQIAVRQGLPTVVTTHGSDAYSWARRRPGLRRAAKEALSRATRVTAVSNFLADCVKQIVPRDVDVIWNGADERFFYPRDRSDARAELSLPADRFMVAYAGNLVPQKGIADLIDALAGLPQLSPLLVVAGVGPQRAQLQEQAARSRVDVRFLGLQPSERIGSMFAAADAVVLPSYNEGLPNVVCETMLSGRLIVAATVGGVPEIVQDKRTGLLFKPGDVVQLRALLAQVAGDPQRRLAIEAAAREFACANLTWRISAQRYEAVLAQAAAAS